METERAAFWNWKGKKKKKIIMLPITSYDFSLYKYALKSHITAGLLHPVTTDPWVTN